MGESTMINVENNYDMYSLTLTGSATLTTTVGQFGQGSIKYSKSGDLANFNAQVNGKYADEEVILSVTKSGSFNDLAMTATASVNGDVINMNAFMKTLNGLDGSLQIQTPFNNYKNIGMKLTHHGDISDF